ncbi:MAG: hypothetical protein GC171_04610 [Terrimonas sp.]|nr:hypothetical protein [Terrimonas sp.]
MNCYSFKKVFVNFDCKTSRLFTKPGLLGVLIFLSGTCLWCQPNTGLQFTFKNFNNTNGLISNHTNAVVQDAEGFLWIGGTDGLQRYDGVRFRNFRNSASDSNSLPSNTVAQLMIDHQNRLWVLLADGHVGIFDTKKFSFKTMKINTRDPNDIVFGNKRLIKDEWGNVFMLIWKKELLHWQEEKQAFSGDNKLFGIRDSWKIEDFYPEPGTHKYWIAVTDLGFAVYNAGTGNTSYYGNNIEKEKIIDVYGNTIKPYNLHFDRQGRLWFQYWETVIPLIYCFDLPHKKPLIERGEMLSQLGSYHEIYSFFEQGNGDIWIRGTKILARFNEHTRTFEMVKNGYTNSFSIEYDNITCLTEDREQNIWVSTNNNGLYSFNPAEEHFINVTHDVRIGKKRKGYGNPLCFVQLRDKTVLSGAWGDGLYRYDSIWNEIPLQIRGIPDKNLHVIWDIFASRDSNTIWMSGQPGIWRYDQQQKSASFYNPAVFRNRTVRQVAEDKQGNLWLGLQGYGVFKWDAQKGKDKFENGIERVTSISASQTVSKIIKDTKGYIWICMSSDGLVVLDPETGKTVLKFSAGSTGAYRLPEDGVSSVLEYDDSLMVITTSTRAIIYNRYTKTSKILGNEQIISGYISSVERDDHGYLWISTTTGLYRVTLQNKMFVLYDRRDGIANEEFSLAASYHMPDGKLLFGGSGQFIVFQPNTIDISRIPPPTATLTGMMATNRPLRVDSILKLDKINLGFKQNSLEFEFSTLRFFSPYIVRYKMEGIDKTWKVSDRNYTAIYSYLPPGTYKFLLKTEDTDGKEGPVSSLQIVIAPPFWGTWWFYSLLVLAGGLLIFWFDRERMKRKEAIVKMRTEIAANLHEEINKALNNINILSEMARLKAGQNTPKAVEYIEQIHSKSHNMIIAMDDILWNIDPENDSMSKAIDRLREYIDALKNRQGVQIDLMVDKKVEHLKLNMQLRQSIFRLFKGGISNFIKTGALNCQIDISLEKNNIVYTVEFDNSKTDLQLLNNLLKRQELEQWLNEIHAKLSNETHTSRSVITLVIPLK